MLFLLRVLLHHFLIIIGLVIVGTIPAFAQVFGVAPDELRLSSPRACSTVVAGHAKSASGGQWLIGPRFELYGASNAQRSQQNLTDQFTKVTCYSRVRATGLDRTFVSTDGNETCGWVDTDTLLSPNAIGQESSRRSVQAVCDVPRAMTLRKFCDDPIPVAEVREDLNCDGAPLGLRTKGVLTGSTEGNSLPRPRRYPFLSAPTGGDERETKLFFSVLEIHEIARGDDETIMALVGDGKGDMFGWIDHLAFSLWPTRLGLYYDSQGRGAMFQHEADLFGHILTGGQPSPDILPGHEPAKIDRYLHGNLPLLSYPIIRVRDPAKDGNINQQMPLYHEVIFLGRSGEGSAAELMSEAELSQQVQQLKRVNVMVVLDSTESMRPYLPAVREGIADFVRSYRSQKIDPTNRLPEVRIGVYAYSDFLSSEQTELSDPIDIAELMPPTRISSGFNIERPLRGIANHAGLDDAVGLLEEAAMETVYRLSESFASTPGWFEDGPRIIVHLADHGSRSSVDMDTIEARLRRERVYYVPLPLITNDGGSANGEEARGLFARQSRALFANIVRDGDTEGVIRSIDITVADGRRAGRVTEALEVISENFVRLADILRSDVLGEDIPESSFQAIDIAASRIILGERVLEDRGLSPDDVEVIVQATTGFAPAALVRNGIREPVDWTYTIALEPGQANRVREQFSQMCDIVGRPDRGQDFGSLVAGLAAAFSGDVVESNVQLLEILSDMRDLPGAADSLLGLRPEQIVQKAYSEDQAAIAQLRQEVCWTSYHLNNYEANLYVQPDQLAWTGEAFALKDGETAVGRSYLYSPRVGAETVYFPAFFFVLPQIYEARARETGNVCVIFCD